MARRKRQSEVTVSLFPFLSILACILGTLTLIIAAMVIGQMGGGEDKRTHEYGMLKTGNEKDRAKITELEKLVSEAARVGKELAAARAELKRLQDLPHSPDEHERMSVALLAKADALRKRLTELENDAAKLRADRDRLKTQYDALPSKEKAVVQILPPKGQAAGLKARFIECAVDALVVHPEGRRIRRGDVATSALLKTVLSEVEANRRRNWTVTFLIRPDGVATFDEVRKVVRERGTRHGFMPLPGQGRIDFSQIARWSAKKAPAIRF